MHPLYRFPFFLLTPVLNKVLHCIRKVATKYKVYDLLNPNVNDEQELDEISKEFCYSVEKVELDKMIKKVKAMPNSN